MTSRHRASRLAIKRCSHSHLQRRTFVNGSAKYDELSQSSYHDAAGSEPHRGTRKAFGHETEVERRARVLKKWNAQILGSQRGDGTVEQGGRPGPVRIRKHAPKIPIRKIRLDVSEGALESALRYYLKPRKGAEAQARLEEQAARDPALLYALSQDPSTFQIPIAKKLALAQYQRSKARPSETKSSIREEETERGRRRLPVHKIWSEEEELERRQRQAAEDRKKNPPKNPRKILQHDTSRRSRKVQDGSMMFHAVIKRWQNENLPPVTHNSHYMTRKALTNITTNWVDSLEPRFTAQSFSNFATEVSVFGRVMAERYNRELSETHPRLSLQNLLLKRCIVTGIKLSVVLQHIDYLLYSDEVRNSPLGAILESHAQRVDSWIVAYGETLENFIPRLGRFCDQMSDEEVTRKARDLNVYNTEKVYFDPKIYSGTIDPVFWPRPQPSGI